MDASGDDDLEPKPRILKIGLIVGLIVFYGLLILVGLNEVGGTSAIGLLPVSH